MKTLVVEFNFLVAALPDHWTCGGNAKLGYSVSPSHRATRNQPTRQPRIIQKPMKLYWPIALTCSVVGCIILLPIAGDMPAPQIFIGFEHIGYALASGALMALMCKRFFEKASWPWALGTCGIFGLAHVSIFGALVGLLNQGTTGMIENFFLAPKLAMDKFYIFFPMCLGAHAAIKWAALTEVENVSILD